ncbi:sugar phosphate isomerase/epimerase [Halorussus sp. MSC15.2]|uniref:sugar phosphate isomerase/epimerase family protein n=1 Tax=Halorussus sp. MSC15.2 TaxID=2283638 RepID=UPI0013D00EF0|nr:sugar phosphate isomerase/epimerase [Halorussus sp. MSC15.2]NEU55998.1 sugar phosphate isomerase/epimerase [Halorussus sp. MSC15.2]
MRPAIQLYTLRELDEPLPDLLRRVGDTAFEGVEFAGLGDSDPDEIRNALDDAGLDAAAAHVGVEALESDLDGVVESYESLDCDRVVVPYLDETQFASEAAVTDTARRLETLAGRLDERGIALGYHNHDHEFAALGGRTAFDLLADETDFDLELDVGWATAAGRDPIDLLGHLRGRVPLVHLKDVAGDRPVELGEGDVDAEACVRAAREAGTEWLVYEHDDPEDPEASLAHGAETLAGLLS